MIADGLRAKQGSHVVHHAEYATNISIAVSLAGRSLMLPVNSLQGRSEAATFKVLPT